MTGTDIEGSCSGRLLSEAGSRLYWKFKVKGTYQPERSRPPCHHSPPPLQQGHWQEQQALLASRVIANICRLQEIVANARAFIHRSPVTPGFPTRGITRPEEASPPHFCTKEERICDATRQPKELRSVGG